MLSKKVRSRRIFKGYGECVIVTEYWNKMATIEYFGKKGCEKEREKVHEGIYTMATMDRSKESKDDEYWEYLDECRCPDCCPMDPVLDGVEP